MKSYDSKNDTEEHIIKVFRNIQEVRHNLHERQLRHDQSKLLEPEKSLFDKYTPLLRETTYGSEQYKQHLSEMGEALRHHYSVNDHHPEHHEFGVKDMSLMAVIEMLCDWKAASERHADGDFLKSLRINRDRFGIEDETMLLILNTCIELGWIDNMPENSWWHSIKDTP